jgi:hypothetical protein
MNKSLRTTGKKRNPGAGTCVDNSNHGAQTLEQYLLLGPSKSLPNAFALSSCSTGIMLWNGTQPYTIQAQVPFPSGGRVLRNVVSFGNDGLGFVPPGTYIANNPHLLTMTAFGPAWTSAYENGSYYLLSSATNADDLTNAFNLNSLSTAGAPAGGSWIKLVSANPVALSASNTFDEHTVTGELTFAQGGLVCPGWTPLDNPEFIRKTSNSATFTNRLAIPVSVTNPSSFVFNTSSFANYANGGFGSSFGLPPYPAGVTSVMQWNTVAGIGFNAFTADDLDFSSVPPPNLGPEPLAVTNGGTGTTTTAAPTVWTTLEAADVLTPGGTLNAGINTNITELTGLTYSQLIFDVGQQTPTSGTLTLPGVLHGYVITVQGTGATGQTPGTGVFFVTQSGGTPALEFSGPSGVQDNLNVVVVAW